MRKVFWVLGGVVVLAACVNIPESGKSAFILTSPQQEASLGAQSFAEIKKTQKISTDPAANARVKQVVERLAPFVNAPGAVWEVVVFDDPTPNAFALPGGKVGVNTGILPIAKNDAGLAAILGHEMAHVALRHGGQRVSQQLAVSGAVSAANIYLSSTDVQERDLIMSALGAGASVGVVLPFSRSNEHEADRQGMIYMARAGYDPREAVEVWKRMETYSAGGNKPPEFLSTHPADASRIRALQEMLPQAEMIYRRSR